ncbi:MAG: Nif3-like dinuclear metal center hexameric protein [Oscillospiraceae bacterium]|jgi:dinuclear metal center YbgI/SA1388 family protein|nr:Nif3-like dinuclear metal center hexameric protein [Oscillospiraceae bacterium]
MPTVNDVFEFLKSMAPIEMKMDFDNVGLLVGSGGADASKMLLSLDITHDVITEASDIGAGLIISHHPLFFSLKSITDSDVTGRKIMRLLSRGISAICMHTNLDAALGGTSDALAAAAGISREGEAADLLSQDGTLRTGRPFSYGRVGHLKGPLPLGEYLVLLKKALNSGGLRFHDSGRDVCKIAVVSGSGGSELHHAVGQGCDTFVTSDIKYDVFLEAKELGINLIDGDHFCTENLVMAPLAKKLCESFPETNITVSSKHGQTAKFF